MECSHIAMDLGVHKEEVKRIMEAQLQLDKETTTTQLRRLLAQQGVFGLLIDSFIVRFTKAINYRFAHIDIHTKQHCVHTPTV